MDDVPLSQQSTAAAARDMMERHALEMAQLEERLRAEEIAKINEVFITFSSFVCIEISLFL